jgi:hypothetical protein
MKKFSDFGIKPAIKNFVGDKIKIPKILNKEIVIHDFRIEDTKVENFKKRAGKCLYLQISVGDTKHVVFTSSIGLIEAIQQVAVTDFPFTAIIIEDNDRYIFT